jgi:hypothetical protein
MIRANVKGTMVVGPSGPGGASYVRCLQLACTREKVNRLSCRTLSIGWQAIAVFLLVTAVASCSNSPAPSSSIRSAKSHTTSPLLLDFWEESALGREAAFSPTGNLVAVVTHNGSVVVIQVATGVPLAVIPGHNEDDGAVQPKKQPNIRWSPTERVIGVQFFVGDMSVVTLVDLPQGIVTAEWKASDAAELLGISDTERTTLLWAGAAYTRGSAETRWNKVVDLEGFDSYCPEPGAADYDSEKDWYAVSCGSTLGAWNTKTGKRAFTVRAASVDRVALSRGGGRIAVLEQSGLRVLDAEGVERASYALRQPLAEDSREPPPLLAWVNGRRIIAVASGQITVAWPEDSSVPATTRALIPTEFPLDVSSNGLIAIQTPEDGLKLLEASTGRRRTIWSAVQTPHGRVAAGPPGSRCIATSDESRYFLWDIHEPRILGTVQRGDTKGAPGGLSDGELVRPVSPDCRWVLERAETDSFAVRTGVATDRRSRMLIPCQHLRAGAWSPSGDAIALVCESSGAPARLRVAHVAATSKIAVDRSVAPGSPLLRWSPDSASLAFSDGDGHSVTIVKALSGAVEAHLGTVLSTDVMQWSSDGSALVVLEQTGAAGTTPTYHAHIWMREDGRWARFGPVLGGECGLESRCVLVRETGEIELWDVGRRKRLWSHGPPPLPGSSGWVLGRHATLSADSSILVVENVHYAVVDEKDEGLRCRNCGLFPDLLEAVDVVTGRLIRTKAATPPKGFSVPGATNSGLIGRVERCASERPFNCLVVRDSRTLEMVSVLSHEPQYLFAGSFQLLTNGAAVSAIGGFDLLTRHPEQRIHFRLLRTGKGTIEAVAVDDMGRFATQERAIGRLFYRDRETGRSVRVLSAEEVLRVDSSMRVDHFVGDAVE